MPNERSYETALERSDAIRADLAEHPGAYTMLTGDRPTGRLHLGHYFGTLKGRVELQDMGVRTNVLIADYQVITDRDTTEHIQDNVYNMVMDYLACGIDPDKTMIYAHSAVPAANQLMLPFLSLVSEAELAAQPHGEGRDGGLRPRAHRPSAHLPGPPGLRHPVLQGQRGARRPRPAAAHRAHPSHRAPLQQPLRAASSPRSTPCCPTRRCCRASTGAR